MREIFAEVLPEDPRQLVVLHEAARARSVLARPPVNGVDLDSDLGEHAQTPLDSGVRLLDARIHLHTDSSGSPPKGVERPKGAPQSATPLDPPNPL